MTLAGISLRDLEYVVAVADQASFVRAAELCNVSQPSLSAQSCGTDDISLCTVTS